MRKWMRAVLMAVVALFAIAATNPHPADALDTDEILLWSAVGTGAAILVVLVATYFTRDESQLFLHEPVDDAGADLRDERRLHVGLECRKPDGTAAILCW